MKKEVPSKVSDLIKPVVLDPTAETITELASTWCVGQTTAQKYVKNLLAEGRIIAVRKKVGQRTVAAYRTVK